MRPLCTDFYKYYHNMAADDRVDNFRENVKKSILLKVMNAGLLGPTRMKASDCGFYRYWDLILQMPPKNLQPTFSNFAAVLRNQIRHTSSGSKHAKIWSRSTQRITADFW